LLKSLPPATITLNIKFTHAFGIYCGILKLRSALCQARRL
jgi:hypothetical protein